MKDFRFSTPKERPRRRSVWRRLSPLTVAATVFVACVALTFRAPTTRAAGWASWTDGELTVELLRELSVAGWGVKPVIELDARATESMHRAGLISESDRFRVFEVSEQEAARPANEPGVTQRNDFNAIFLNAVESNTPATANNRDFALVAHNGQPAMMPVITGVSAVITSESCPPPNGRPDPGETVTVNVTLRNDGTAATNGNLIATLTPTGGAGPIGGTNPQNYGTLAIGASATRAYTFTVSRACGGTLTMTLNLADGSGSLGTATFTFQVSVNALTENFDTVTPPALPAGWTATNASGPLPLWVTSSVTPDTAPNCAFVDDPPVVSDKRLDTPSFTLTTSAATLTFRNFYNLETFWDGGVLEISINGGPFQDILAAGGSFVTGGYNNSLVSSPNPLAGRQAWSGNSGGYITTTVNLPGSGTRTVVLRFRMGSDSSVGAPGWRIDTLTVQDGFNCCGAVLTPNVIFTSQTTTEAPGVCNSDGDGFFEPCETLQSAITVTNVGGATATTATATITTTTPNVTILTGTTPNLGPIAPGGTATGNVTFRLEPNFVPGTPVNINVSVAFGPGGPSPSLSSYTAPTGCPSSPVGTFTFSNTAPITIPAFGTATPYPSTINVSGVTAPITKVTVTINDFNHAWPADVGVALRGPGGQLCVLFNNAIGVSPGVTNRTYTFDQTATPLPLAGFPPSGTYQPGDYNATRNFQPPLPSPPYNSNLNIFNGLSGASVNGTWELYVRDFVNPDGGSINGGWSLTIETGTPNCSTTACNLANVNPLVSLTSAIGPLVPLTGCSGYTHDLTINGTLVNASTLPLSNIAVEVQGLGFPDSTPTGVIVASPNPHRLVSADGAGCGVGGQAGAVQTTINGQPPIGGGTPIGGLNPGGSVGLTFRLHLPVLQRFRFFVNVLAVIGCPTTTTLSAKAAASDATPAVVKSFCVEVAPDKSGKPAVTTIEAAPDIAAESLRPGPTVWAAKRLSLGMPVRRR